MYEKSLMYTQDMEHIMSVISIQVRIQTNEDGC